MNSQGRKSRTNLNPRTFSRNDSPSLWIRISCTETQDLDSHKEHSCLHISTGSHTDDAVSVLKYKDIFQVCGAPKYRDGNYPARPSVNKNQQQNSPVLYVNMNMFYKYRAQGKWLIMNKMYVNLPRISRWFLQNTRSAQDADLGLF